MMAQSLPTRSKLFGSSLARRSRAAAVFIFLSLLASFVPGAEAAPKIAVFAYGSEPYIDLDPRVEYSNGILPLHNIYETLGRYNPSTGKIDPLLAESWSSDESGVRWTFKIRSGVKFHDGSSLTAGAVKRSIEKTIEMKQGASYIWDAVETIEAPDDSTVVFTLKNPAPLDLIVSASYAAFIISPEAIDRDGSWFNEGNDGGTGPYSIARVQKGEQVALKKFDDYWKGWSEGQFDGAIIKKYSESSSRRQLIEKGDALITSELSASDMKAMLKNPGVTVHSDPSWKNVIGFWNTEKPPLDNVDLRRALCSAFPYDEVVQNVLDGYGRKATGLIPAGLWGHGDDLGAPEFDMELAAKYLKQSGVNPADCKFEVTFTSGSEAYRSAMQIYRANLKKLGIELNIREMTWDNVWERSKNKKPEDRQDLLLMNWWPDYPSPLSWFYSLARSEDGIVFNLSYIKDPKLDAMIDEADAKTATDRAAAERLFMDAQRELADKAYFLYMFDRADAWVVSNKATGFTSNPAYATVVFFYDLKLKQ